MIFKSRNIKSWLIIGFCLMLFSTFTKAQSSKSVINLTLDKAISIALKANYDLQLSTLQLKRSDERITEAYSGLYPQINFTGTYLWNVEAPVLFLPPGTPFNPGTTTQTLTLGADNSYNVGFSLKQALFDPKLGSAISIANDYSQYSKYINESDKNDVIATVKAAYYKILLGKKLVEVAQQNYDLSKANYENTKKLYDQGVTSEFDFLRSEVQVANIEPDLINVKNELELAKNDMKYLLGFDLSTQIDATGELTVEEIPADLLEQSNEILMKQNPVILSLSIQQQIFEENVSIAKANYFPILSGIGSYNWQADDNTFNFNNYNWANTFTLGLQLSYPIIDGFSREAKIQLAKIDVDASNITKAQTEAGLNIRLLKSQLNMTVAQEKLKAQGKSVSQAERALHISQVRYNNGVGTQIEILDTQNALIEAQVNYERSKFEFILAKIEWERILGISE